MELGDFMDGVSALLSAKSKLILSFERIEVKHLNPVAGYIKAEG